MNGEIGQAIQEAAQAIQRFLLAFEQHIDGLESAGADGEEVKRLSKGFHAVRDSAGIYMTWAKHFAKLVEEGEADALEDLEGFLNEGGDTRGNPLFGP